MPSPSYDSQVHRTALIVEPTLADQVLAISALSNSGFQINVADNFHAARALLEQCRPAVLVTEIRLKEYNGLHLVLRGKSSNPGMAVVITSAWTDPVLQAEAEFLAATFVAKPAGRQELLAAVLRTCHRSADDLMAPIRPPFERRMADRRRELNAAFSPERRLAAGRRRDDHPITAEHVTVG